MKRRSVSELVLEAMGKRFEQDLPRCKIEGKEVSLMQAVWMVFEQDRLVKLALIAPELLTEDEQKIWRVISEDRKYLPKGGDPNYAAIRTDWKVIQHKVRKYEESARE